jgi:hypothetical protein
MVRGLKERTGSELAEVACAGAAELEGVGALRGLCEGTAFFGADGSAGELSVAVGGGKGFGSGGGRNDGRSSSIGTGGST